MNKNIALIYGDCSSPEIVTQAVRVLDKIAAKHGHTFSYTRAYMGGEAIDKFGDPLPAAELEKCKQSDSVLLGAIGGPKWEGMPGDRGQRVAGHPGRRRAVGYPDRAGGLERPEERRGRVGVDGDVAPPAAPLGRRRHTRREHAPLGHVAIGARVRGVEEEDGQAAAHVLIGHEGEADRLAHGVELDRDHAATSP